LAAGAGLALLALLGLAVFALTSPGSDGEPLSWGGSLFSNDSTQTTGSSTGLQAAEPPAKGQASTPSGSGSSAPGTTPGASGSTPPPSAAVPSGTAQRGAQLTEVRTPPDRTLSAISVPAGFISATFAVTFEPYGLGPQGPSGSRIVIFIVSAEPDAGASELSDLSGRNAIVYLAPDAAGAVTVGGRYEGYISVRVETEGRGELHLAEVKPAR
jgi:hypothetical protein